MSELTPKPSTNGTSGTDGFNGSTVTTLQPHSASKMPRQKASTGWRASSPRR